MRCCIISSFYIKPQLSNGKLSIKLSCIISSFYIKPQPPCNNSITLFCCIISSFYIKPQRIVEYRWILLCCIISSFYIKPQPIRSAFALDKVVLYLHSTSNHNYSFNFLLMVSVVLYLHSTSNHNKWSQFAEHYLLYYIFILHQTTTGTFSLKAQLCCIISSFYIKPQPFHRLYKSVFVVLYLHSTSNHNLVVVCPLHVLVVLYLHSTSNHNLVVVCPLHVLVVLYLHSTSNHNWPVLMMACALSCIISSFYIKPQLKSLLPQEVQCCIISSFYIKPQLQFLIDQANNVVLYLHSTSNHNRMRAVYRALRLYYIFILHQTTTRPNKQRYWE